MTDYNTKEELQLMQQAGMDFPEILASLTTAPAKRFGYAPKTGKIEKGMDADLVLLSEDPASDIEAFSKVAYTFRKGTLIFRTP